MKRLIALAVVALEITCVAASGPLVFISPSIAQADQTPRASEKQLQQVRAWIYALAVQAATYGAPIVAMYNLRDGDAVGAKAKAPPNEIWRMENISTPQLAAGYWSSRACTLPTRTT
jgi:hypothetical protein